MPTRLNLGCSTDLRGGEWTNVDIVPVEEMQCAGIVADGVGYQQADLALPWPWKDSSVDEIYAADIFEHIGDCQHVGFQICPNCYGAPFEGKEWERTRRSRQGGASGCGICGIMPCMCLLRHWSGRIHAMNEAWRSLRPGGILTMECPDAAKGAGQWQDPTHVSPWTPNALQYYTDGSPAHKRFAAAYGIAARFKVLSMTERLYSETAGELSGYGVGCNVWKFTARLEAVK